MTALLIYPPLYWSTLPQHPGKQQLQLYFLGMSCICFIFQRIIILLPWLFSSLYSSLYVNLNLELIYQKELAEERQQEQLRAVLEENDN